MGNPAELVKMPKLATGMQNSKGFTLIEILVVIIVVGIVSTVAIISFGDFGKTRKIQVESEHFAVYLKMLQQKAILENHTIGLKVSEYTYEPFQYEPSGWVPFFETQILKKQRFGANILASELSHPHTKERFNAMIIIQPSGDFDPFILFLGTESSPKTIKIIGHSDGSITISEADAKE